MRCVKRNDLIINKTFLLESLNPLGFGTYRPLTVFKYNNDIFDYLIKTFIKSSSIFRYESKQTCHYKTSNIFGLRSDRKKG